MGKFDGILFCTDLDGTLYRNDHTVSQENLDAIEYFKSEGGLFTFITGRVPLTSHEICRMIKPNAPFGCVNGGGIYDPQKQGFLWMKALPAEAMSLVEYIADQLPDVGIQVNTEKQIYFHTYDAAMQWFCDITGVSPTMRRCSEVTEPVLKVIFASTEENKLNAVAEMLNDHPLADRFAFVRSEQTLYELLPKGVNKGTALKRMAQLLGIDMRRTVAVGDYENDVSMLKTAGIGYAVANARPAAKAVADRFTVSNEEHAIAAIVTELEQGILDRA